MSALIKQEEATEIILEVEQRPIPASIIAALDENKHVKPEKALVAEVVLRPWRQVRNNLDIEQSSRMRIGPSRRKLHWVTSAVEDSEILNVKAEPNEDTLDMGNKDETKTDAEIKNEELIPLTQADMVGVMNRLYNDKAKIKKESQFEYRFVLDRLKAVGLDRYSIPLDAGLVEMAVNRYYISGLYGGSFVSTFPDISKARAAVHGVDDFMMLSLEFNPHAPVNAGDPGLFFRSTPSPGHFGHHEIFRVFVGLHSGWCYMGQYKMYDSESLTTAEWERQSDKVKKTWGTQILQKSWGMGVAAAIYFRRENGRNPTDEEIDSLTTREAFQDVFSSLSWQEVSDAYARGDETMGVWCMKCVGYDVEFKRFLIEDYLKFVPPKRKGPRDPSKRPRKIKRISQDND